MSLDENGTSGNVRGGTGLSITPLPSPAPAIRLWWCGLEATPGALQSCEGYLSQPERARAARFGNPRLRDRYVVGRGALRLILGRLLDRDPAEVSIIRGTRGRPQLAEARALDFNVSHTGDIALVGTLAAGRIGVDVERIDRMVNVAGIARKFLSEDERRELDRLDGEAARRRVLALWTCKEAMSKATGDALSAPFASIDIDLQPSPRVRHGSGAYRPEGWSLYAASLPSGHVGTVAVWHPR